MKYAFIHLECQRSHVKASFTSFQLLSLLNLLINSTCKLDISESIQCTSQQNCNTSLHCNNTNHMSGRLLLQDCSLSSAANTWEFTLRLCERRFHCFATWQLPDASPTNDRKGDRTKRTHNTTQHRAAETESELKGCYRTGERARITTTIVSICSPTRISQPDHQIPDPHLFINFNLQRHI